MSEAKYKEMNSIDSNLILARGEFRRKLRAYCKQAGINQSSLARAVGLSRSRFSERLNETTGSPFFNISEVKAIVSYLDSQNAFYEDTEGPDLLHTVYPPKAQKAQKAMPMLANQSQAMPEAVGHTQSEELVFTATTTTTITTTITATTTFTAGKLALTQTELSGLLPTVSSGHLLTQSGGGSQSARLLNLNKGNSDQEKALAQELARLVLEYLSLNSSSSSDSKGYQEAVSVDIANS